MIKRTLYFGSPAYLSLSDRQLVVRRPAESPDGEDRVGSVPVEDIGMVVIDNARITITSGLIAALLENNVALISCDRKSLPTGLMLPLCGHTIQNERFRCQLSASLPLKKQLWQQTVQMKILNQSVCLEYSTGVFHENMAVWSSKVRSGDSDNLEARAAAYYWKNLFPEFSAFVRGRSSLPPNNLLDYGYAILRGVIARALVSSGMLPTIGIHHHNRYNAYCLADDIMEPYRPYVDRLVVDIVRETPESGLVLDKAMKARLLSIPVLDVFFGGRASPLMVAASTTSSSLYKCFLGEARKIVYPSMKDEPNKSI